MIITLEMIIFRILEYVINIVETCDLHPKSYHSHKPHSAQENSIGCLYIFILQVFVQEDSIF